MIVLPVETDPRSCATPQDLVGVAQNVFRPARGSVLHDSLGVRAATMWIPGGTPRLSDAVAHEARFWIDGRRPWTR